MGDIPGGCDSGGVSKGADSRWDATWSGVVGL